MEKDKVIKLRTALKAGKNLPLTVLIDNCFRVIDESMTGHFTFWDDTNGILYEMAYADIQSDKFATNKKQVSMFAVDYDCIQCIKNALIKVEDLDDLFTTIKASGKDISDDRIAMIKNFYNKVLDTDRYELSHEETNKLLGSNLDTRDDYYHGKIPEVVKQMFIGINNVVAKAPLNKDKVLYRFCCNEDPKEMKVGDVVNFPYNLTCTNFDWNQAKYKNVYVITPLPNGKTRAHNLYEIYEHGDEKQVDFLRDTSFMVTKVEETKGTPYRKYYLKELSDA